jgi:hypothetical protein
MEIRLKLWICDKYKGYGDMKVFNIRQVGDLEKLCARLII